MKTFSTKAATAITDKDERGERPSDRVCSHYSPSQEEEIVCTTDELEEFENANEVAFTSDIIDDQGDYDSFVRFLSEQCGLEELS